MAEKVISILLSAKDATASAFDRAKGGVKDLGKDSQSAMSGIKAASTAVSQAMSGDLVGAAKSASTAFNQLWKVISKHPYMALAGAIGAVVLALPKLISYQRDAAAAADEHERSIVGLKRKLDELNGTDLLSNVKANIQSKIDAMDYAGIAADLELAKSAYAHLRVAANEYINALENLKVGGLGKAQEEKEQKRLQELLDGVLDKMAELKKAEELYNKAISDRRKEAATAAAEEATASALAIANIKERIDREIELAQAIRETFLTYEAEQAKQNAAVLDNVSAIEKQTARTIELMGAKEPLLKAEIERKHIQEDLADMMSAESADTIELAKKQSELAIKEAEIAKIKEAAAAAAEKEAADRLKGAKEVLKTEKEIAQEKQKALTAYIAAEGSLEQRAIASRKAKRAGDLKNWKKYLPGAEKPAVIPALPTKLTKQEIENQAGARSAADKSIGINVQKIADTLEESLKPA